MFNSKITAAEIINQINDEADISYPVPDENYILWLNAVEQLLYTEIIKEQAEITLDGSCGDLIILNNLPTYGDTIRFEDIYAVYVNDTQLIKSTLTSGVIFPDSYCKIQDNLGLHVRDEPKQIRIIYNIRPVLKTAGNIDTEYIRLPTEFVDLVKAKLRGEAYKLANEDALAGKWLNDYNILLETFKGWISNKQPLFGL